jgi:hypothetical protein
MTATTTNIDLPLVSIQSDYSVTNTRTEMKSKLGRELFVSSLDPTRGLAPSLLGHLDTRFETGQIAFPIKRPLI